VALHQADHLAVSMGYSTHRVDFWLCRKFLLLDPSLLEEKVMDGLLVVAMNKHREICSLHVSGAVTVHQEMVFRCSDIAAKKVGEITELIQNALKQDAAVR